MKPTPAEKLRETAQITLRNNKNDVKAALPAFVRAVQRASLIEALALPYLEQQLAAMPGAGSVKVEKYQTPAHRRRTPEEAAAARRATLATADAVYETLIEGRAIGDMAMGEVREKSHQLVQAATRHIMLGVNEVKNAILLDLINRHCAVDDQLAKVRDTIGAKKLAEFAERAEREAPELTELGMHKAAEAMEQRRSLQ